MISLSVRLLNQTKTEFDYTTPLNKRLAVRLVATYRNEDLVNGVPNRFAFGRRWNVNPSVTLKLTPRSQLRFFAEFLTENAYKHWGENGMFAAVTVPNQRPVAAAASHASGARDRLTTRSTPVRGA